MTQSEALEILKTGANVFLTGEAGSGKTYVINQYTRYLREHGIDCAVTASTGIAATHIHGMTLHAWSGIGIARTLDDEAIREIAKNRYVAKRIKKAKVLIIDEVSMLDGAVLDMVERVCRAVRKGRLPFGGVQVVLVGDFFQLPPVKSERGGDPCFAFESSAWAWIDPKVCYLTEQHRQEDEVFLDLLSAIRRKTWNATYRKQLEERLVSLADVPDEATRLFSHNVDVDRINQGELSKLEGKMYRFIMAVRGPEALTDTIRRGCLSPERLELKEGAVVMFTKNNLTAGFVNGTLGVVTGFEGIKHLPVVRTYEGERIVVEPMEWVMTEGEETVAKITQLPLRLAWAITIHKSQGVSLDAAVMDLSRVFEFGQGYVALSRVRRFSGVYLLGVSEQAFEVHPAVFEEDICFRTASQKATEDLAFLSAAERKALHARFRVLCGGKERNTRRALVTKRRDVETSLEKIRKTHAKAYRLWTHDEEATLTRLFHRGIPIARIATELGRPVGSIRSRMKKQGLKEV